MVTPDFQKLLASLCRERGYIEQRERLIRKWGYLHFRTMQKVAFLIVSQGRQDRYLSRVPDSEEIPKETSLGASASYCDEPRPWLALS